MNANLRERRLQEKNVLKVRVGGLPTQWDSWQVDYEAGLTTFLETLHPVHIDADS